MMITQGNVVQLKESHRISRKKGDFRSLFWNFTRSGRKNYSGEVKVPQPRLNIPMIPSKYRPFRMGGKEYLMSLEPLTVSQKLLPLFRLAEDSYAEDYMPVTVIDYSEDRRRSHSIESTVRKFSARDDVFSTQFLWSVVLNRNETASTGLSILAEDKDYLKSVGCSVCYINAISGCVEKRIPEGPYFMKKGTIHRIWRLYPDTHDAFNLPLVQSSQSPDTFDSVWFTNEVGQAMIPVPSRLTYQTSTSKPLANVRLAIKDLFDVKGVKTSGQNRAYESLYPEAEETAHFLRKLLDLGAVIVGKTKCTQFGSGEQPTADWIETHCPWNPRGDGYLSPRGSSTGSGVAIAAYSWVDVGIGTDTGGSIRGPAIVMGLFALRPSHGITSSKGILPCSEYLDTSGFMCRDPVLFAKFIQNCYEKPGRAPVEHKRPTRLVCLTDYFPYANEAADRIMNLYISKMEKCLNCERIEINVAQTWQEIQPNGVTASIFDFLSTTYPTMMQAGYYKHYQKFRADYQTKFQAVPYVNPTMQTNWDRGSKLSENDVTQAKKEKEVYQEFMEEHVFQSRLGLFNTIVVYPVGDPKPFYRDTYRPAPWDMPPYSWKSREGDQASLGGWPDAVIPIGQIPYRSRVTGKDEIIPVTLAIMASRHEDHALAMFVKDFYEYCGLKPPKAGKTAYD